MPWCDDCKYFSVGICKKYDKLLHRSSNACHSGFSIHPFDYVRLYYDKREEDIKHLMEIANKYLTSDTAKSICKQYKENGDITFKQRKVIISQILNCYEQRNSFYEKQKTDTYFSEIED